VLADSLRFQKPTNAKPETVTSNPNDRQSDHQLKEKPTAHFSTFGFARPQKQPLRKTKRAKIFPPHQANENYFDNNEYD